MDDQEHAEMAKVAAKKQEKAKAKADAAREARKEMEARKEREAEEARAAEAKKWEEAKAAAALREAAKVEKQETLQKELSPSELVLQAIDELSQKVAEHDEHVKRLERLEKVLGPTAEKLGKRARRSSKDLQEQVAKLMNGALEEAFKQFDLDGSGTLDATELAAAYKAAGLPVDETKIAKCVKMLDTNGDGEIDLEEFKQIAVKMKTEAQSAAA